jgi:hypothetical protein
MESQIIKSLGSRNKFLGSGISKMPIRINIREHRSGNQEWTTQRKWKHREHKTQDEDKQQNKIQHNTTQYVEIVTDITTQNLECKDT